MQAHSYVEGRQRPNGGTGASPGGPLHESADMGDVPLSQVYLQQMKLAPVSMTMKTRPGGIGGNGRTDSVYIRREHCMSHVR